MSLFKQIARFGDRGATLASAIALSAAIGASGGTESVSAASASAGSSATSITNNNFILDFDTMAWLPYTHPLYKAGIYRIYTSKSYNVSALTDITFETTAHPEYGDIRIIGSPTTIDYDFTATIPSGTDMGNISPISGLIALTFDAYTAGWSSTTNRAIHGKLKFTKL